MRTIKEIAPLDALGVYVLSDDNKMVERFSLISGHRSIVSGEGQILTVDDSLLAKFALNNQQVIMNDLLKKRDSFHVDREIAVQAGIRSAATVPIHNNGRISGAMVFDSYLPQAYSDGILPVFQQIADLVSIYLENQCLFQKWLIRIQEVAVKESQMQMIARLNGNLKWQITNVALEIDHILKRAVNNNDLNRDLHTIKSHANRTLMELRSLIADHDDPKSEEACLEKNLINVLKLFQLSTGIRVNIGRVGNPHPSTEHLCDRTTALFEDLMRLIKGKKNVRHVKAQLMWHENNTFEVEIEDDGQINEQELQYEKQLQAIQKRALNAGWQLVEKRILGWGARYKINIPNVSNLKEIAATGADPRKSQRIKILIVKDHESPPSLQEGWLLASEDFSVVLIGIGEDFAPAVQAALPDLVIWMPGQADMKSLLSLPVLPPILRYTGETGTGVQVFGQQGHVLIDFNSSLRKAEFLKTVQNISAGNTSVYSMGETAQPADLQVGLLEALTKREVEILSLVSQGLSNIEIAKTLVVEASTIRWHMHNIFIKINAKNRTQAVNIAREAGLLN
ncbi:MAG: GAF domain-containing protein [Anaerolineaceae bacterium]|nr:GAF domain-containing protein [Anaerolineaceae bacterium]